MSKRQRHLLIDGDVLVYETAFGAQKTVYFFEGQRFNSAKDCQEYVESDRDLDYRKLRKEGKITSQVEVLPDSVCLLQLRKKLSAILDACKSQHYTIFLSGDGNFREEIAVTKKYKGNRDNAVKPIHYAHVRSLILEDENTVCTVGVEADDAMGIAITEDPEAVICTIDKDLNMLPGRHYNWGTGAMYNVSATDSLYFFMKQLLTGDSTDNIPGVPGIGDKKAEELLLPLRDRPKAMFATVLNEYARAPFTIKMKGEPDIVTAEAADYMDEQMALLWMQREPEEWMTAELYATKYLNMEIGGGND